MNLLRFLPYICLAIFLTACTNPVVQPNPNTSDPTPMLKDVISSVSSLADKISHREEALSKIIAATTANMEKNEKAEDNNKKDSPPPFTVDKKAEPELATLLKGHQDQALQNRLSQLGNTVQGIEQIAHAFYGLVTNNQESAYLLSMLKPLFPFETISYILARTYYKAISNNNIAGTDALRKMIRQLSSEQKQQVLGYTLFVDSTYVQSNFRQAIINEAEKIGLPAELFEKEQGDIASLKAHLDAVVIGQEKAKVGLAVAISNHYKRLEKNMKKSNVLVLGPSGTGKTFMVQTIAESLNVPFTVADASDITQAGYIGGKVKDAVVALAKKANYNLGKIERGIIFFDEIDKMAARSGRADSEEFKRQAQATLLKIIEGIDVDVPMGESKLVVNTSKILFVCAGAFTGLSDIIASRLQKENKEIKTDIFSEVTSADLIAYGMTPELLGRLPNFLTLQELTTNDFVRILENPRSSVLEEFKTLFKLQDIELEFTSSAILSIAEKASTFKTGARALRTIVEAIMADLQFRLGSMGNVQSCTITERVIRYNDLPIIAYRTTSK